MASTLLQIVVGFFLGLLELVLTSLVVGSWKSKDPDVDRNGPLGKLVRILAVTSGRLDRDDCGAVHFSQLVVSPYDSPHGLV